MWRSCFHQQTGHLQKECLELVEIISNNPFINLRVQYIIPEMIIVKQDVQKEVIIIFTKHNASSMCMLMSVWSSPCVCVLLFSYSPILSPNSIKPCGLDCKLQGTFPPTRNNLREFNGKKSRLQSMFIRGPRSSHHTAPKIIFMITHADGNSDKQKKERGQIKALSSSSHRPETFPIVQMARLRKLLRKYSPEIDIFV